MRSTKGTVPVGESAAGFGMPTQTLLQQKDSAARDPKSS